jgi:hypothetical protein
MLEIVPRFITVILRTSSESPDRPKTIGSSRDSGAWLILVTVLDRDAGDYKQNQRQSLLIFTLPNHPIPLTCI